jgi:WD40 repeat protein
VLGYPAELSSPLDADHHGVAKFRSVEDPNYEQVRNVLRLFFKSLQPSGGPAIISASDRASLAQLLGVSNDASLDLEVLEDRMMRDSCRWFLRRETFGKWRDGLRDGCSLLWLRGLPGVGKSVLSSFIIRSLQKDSSDATCCYYFFNSQDQKRRSVKHMLSTIAFQVALRSKVFRERLIGLRDSGSFSIDQLQATNIWESVFQGLLLRGGGGTENPMFWIIDGLDEADHPEVLIRLLSKLAPSHLLRILIISRPIKEAMALRSLQIESTVDEIALDDTRDDIRAYAQEAVGYIFPDDADRDGICNKLLEKAQGSFLWVSLAIEELKYHWHTPGTLSQALDELPEGMEAFYDRMIQTIASQPTKPRAMGSRILTWAMCSVRPLELGELKTALSLEFGAFLNLRDSVAQLCANFVIVKKSHVALVHDTARSFLLDRNGGQPLSIDPPSAHGHIAETCLKFLMDQKKDWRRTLTSCQRAAFDKHPFLLYAVSSWAYHASQTSPAPGLRALVRTFLNKFALVWIHAVALVSDMRILTRTGDSLRALAGWETQAAESSDPPGLRGDLIQWSRDLTRFPGRFGSILASNPLAIYEQVVPFCPTGSITKRHFAQAGSISVSGISESSWGHCVGRVMVGDDRIVQIVCQGPYVVAVTLNSMLVVAYAESCEEVRRIDHPDSIIAVASSGTSSLLAVAVWNGIRVWDLGTGEEVTFIPTPSDARALALVFQNEDESLLVGYSDLSVSCIRLSTGAQEWGHMLKRREEMPDHHDNMSISPDGLWVMVCYDYSGKELYAWSLDLPQSPPRRCEPPGSYCRQPYITKQIAWRPGIPSVLIDCFYGNHRGFFEWDLEKDKQGHITPQIPGGGMALSHDATLISACDLDGGANTVWRLPEYQIIHQIWNFGDIEALAFGHDGGRLYTSSGPSCDVWELDGAMDAAIPEMQVPKPAITSLTFDASGRFYLTGTRNGDVSIHDTANPQKTTRCHVASHHISSFGDLCTAWSPTGRYVASGDSQRGVAVHAVSESTSPESPGLAVIPLCSIDLGGGRPLQLLFHPSDEFLLVSCYVPSNGFRPTLHAVAVGVWSLRTGAKICALTFAMWDRGRWLHHPVDNSLVLYVDRMAIRAFKWDSLAEVDLASDGDVQESDADYRQYDITRTDAIIQAIAVGKRHVVFQAMCSPDHVHSLSPMTRRTFAVDLGQPKKPWTGGLVEGPSDLPTYIIGSFRGRLIFLDQDYCFCTWDFEVGAASLKRHFYLPKDWLVPAMLKQCVVNEEGTVLCPRNGEVAVIRGGIKL